MIKPKYMLAVLLSILASTAFADDLTGKWNATMSTPQGAMTMVFDLMADGETLTGSMTADMMGTVEISEGAISDNEFSFNISMQGPGGAMTLNYTGSVDGDALNMSMEFPAGPQGGPPPGGIPLSATRAK